MKSRLLLLALAIYLVATFLFLYPLSLHPGTRIFETGDSYFVAWLWSWETHALTTPGTHFFDGNIFYPEGNTLALSELIWPNQILFAPLLWITQNPLVAYNVTLMTTFPLSALSMLALVFYLTRRFSAAFIAGFIYGFTPIRLSHLHHAQLLSLMWLPLLLLFLDRWLKDRRWRDALATSIFFLLQYLTTVYLALYLVPVMLFYCFFHFLLAQDRWKRLPLFLLQGFAAAVGVALSLAPILKHYQELHQVWDFSPQESMKIFFSSDLWTNLLAVFPTNLLYGKLFQDFSHPPYERFYFTGFLALGLALGAWWARRDRIVKIYAALSAISYLIALGPYLQISGHVTRIPLPYHWTFDWLPGFSMLRVPARVGLIMLTTLSILAAYGWIHLSKRLHSRWPGVTSRQWVTATVAILTVEFLSIPLPLYPAVSGKHVPPVYNFLKTDPDPGGLLELPATFREDGGEPTVRVYTYFSAYHFKPIVIGYSGYFPPPFYDLVGAAQRLPADDALDLFEAIGVRTIILHTSQMSPAENQAWQDGLSSGKRVKRIQSFSDGDEVLRIIPRLRLSANLNDGNWDLSQDTNSPDNTRIHVTLRCHGLHVTSSDVLVNPQLPYSPEKAQSRVRNTLVMAQWIDSRGTVAAKQEVPIRLPYVLNSASIPVSLRKPALQGSYTLKLEVMETPGLNLSTPVSLP